MKALLVSGFLIVESAILGFWYLRGTPWASSRPVIRRLAIFLCLLVCCGFLLVFGGYIETRLGFWSNLERIWEHDSGAPTEPFTAIGDPGLLLRVRAQTPKLSRPDLANAHAFQLWQMSLRGLLRKNLFGWPPITPANRIDHRVMSEKIVEADIKQTFLSYESFDGTQIPAYLLTPSQRGLLPAIIVLHGHIQEKMGEGISQTAGRVDSYHHRIGLELAKAGYVTLMIEFRGFGYLGARIGAEHNLVAYNAILSGSFYKAVLTKDIKYAVDLLQSLKVVNPERIGITGVSFGGEMAITYAALDERIKMVIFQGFDGSIGPQMGKFGNDSEELHLCHLIPNEGAYLRQEDLFLLIAPRPLLGIRGDQEEGWSPEFKDTIERAYSGLGVSSSFRLQVLTGGHEYFVAPAIHFANQHL